MVKRLICAALCLALALCMCGCAALFEKEYLLVEDYVPTVQEVPSQIEKLTVHNFHDLKQAIRGMVNSGQTVGSIIFDSAYDGDVAEDLSDACWQVRTQDALCAYCVVNIFYELNKIVTFYEAQINISYSSHGEKVENIAVLPYSTGVDGIIKEMLIDGSNRGVLLINQSTLSAQEMEEMVAEVYRRNPAIAPRQPGISVKMYSGTNQQRLYEINMSYSMESEELAARKEMLAQFAPFEQLDTSRLSEGQRALVAFEYIRRNISVEPSGQNSTIYSALIQRHADSEGIALAYVELCRQLDVECRIVYGQRNWQDHCWNIIRLGQSYYHVDAALEADIPTEDSFMRLDEQIWDIYRWDMASYPACAGLLSYEDVLKGRDVLPVESDNKAQITLAADGEAGAESEDVFNHLTEPEQSPEDSETEMRLELLREKKDKLSYYESEAAALSEEAQASDQENEADSTDEAQRVEQPEESEQVSPQ